MKFVTTFIVCITVYGFVSSDFILCSQNDRENNNDEEVTYYNLQVPVIQGMTTEQSVEQWVAENRIAHSTYYTCSDKVLEPAGISGFAAGTGCVLSAPIVAGSIGGPGGIVGGMLIAAAGIMTALFCGVEPLNEVKQRKNVGDIVKKFMNDKQQDAEKQ